MNKKLINLLSAGALMLSLSACANNGASVSSSPLPDAESNSPVAPHVETQIQSPLAEYMGLIWNLGLSREEQQRENDARNLFVQEAIAACMREKGFEYNLDLNAGAHFNDGDPALWNPQDREWVAQWGFGLVLTPTLNPWEQWIRMSGDNDANAEFRVDSDNPTPEQWAWQTALWGGPDYEVNRGCSPLAQEASWADTPSMIVHNTEEFRPLFEAMQVMNDSLFNEMGDYEREWIQCMADAGYPNLESHWDAEGLIRAETRNVLPGLWGEPIIFYPGVELTAAQSELHEREIEIALANFDCRAEVDFDAREQQRRWAAEAQFVADHRPALEALRDAVEQLSQPN
jgi:hypothetical protein